MATARVVLPRLLEPVFSGVTDLASLQKLLKTSSHASRQFSTHGVTVFESVLASRHMHHYTCALIRISALLRSKTLPPHVSGLLAFTDYVRYETTNWRYWPPTWVHPPTRLSPTTVSTATLLGLLDTQQEIESHMAGCMKFYLQRFNALRPNSLEDPTFQWGRRSSEEPDLKACDQYPCQKPFPVYDIGPPTWIEEQRILRALWRIQLSRDLKEAAANGSLHWPEGDLNELEKETAVSFHQNVRDFVPPTCDFSKVSDAEWEMLRKERLDAFGFYDDGYGREYDGETLEETTERATREVLEGSGPYLLWKEHESPNFLSTKYSS